MAQKYANRAKAYLAHYDDDRKLSKGMQLANLRQDRQDRSTDVFCRVGYAIRALFGGLFSFLSWRPTTNKCAEYGHVHDRRARGTGGLRCTECGATIESLEQLRGCAPSAKRSGHVSRSVINW